MLYIDRDTNFYVSIFIYTCGNDMRAEKSKKFTKRTLKDGDDELLYRCNVTSTQSLEIRTQQDGYIKSSDCSTLSGTV